MEALKKYMKKTAPFGETKPKGTLKGDPKGEDQYAKTEGKPVTDEGSEDTEMSAGKAKDYEGYGSGSANGGKKKKRAYMTE